MGDASHLIFDRDLLRRRLARHRAAAASHDFLVRHAGEDVWARLGIVQRRLPVALCLGAGATGLAARLRERPGTELVIEAGLDGPGILVDEEALPFGAGSLDLVVSVLGLQLVNDLPGALVQMRRALRPDGLLLAAVLGGSSLAELREAFIAAETELEGGASPRVAPFADVRQLGQLLQRAGFALPVADSDTLEVGYASALHLMRDLRGMGWANPLRERRRSFLRRTTLMRAAEIYAERHARPDGRIKATFELVTLTGWAPHESQPKPLRPGSATTRLADALGKTGRPDEPPRSAPQADGSAPRRGGA
jgi:SAM-dependent methyltransferase